MKTYILIWWGYNYPNLIIAKKYLIELFRIEITTEKNKIWR